MKNQFSAGMALQVGATADLNWRHVRLSFDGPDSGLSANGPKAAVALEQANDRLWRESDPWFRADF